MLLAEGVRFELTREQSPLPVFKTGALNHSATLPSQGFQRVRCYANRTNIETWHPIGTLTLERRINCRRRLTIVLTEQMGVNAQGDVRLRVTEALADRDDVNAGIDKLAGVCMA